MKRILHLIILSGLVMLVVGCADCTHESDYDYVGVTYDDFIEKSGIKSKLNATACDNDANYEGCRAETNNSIRNIKAGFNIQCSGKGFDLQTTIHQLFPVEEYKEDKFDCSDYYVYDFIADRHRSERPYSIDKISVDSNNKNLWNVKINSTCYQWDVTNTSYDMNK